MNNKDSKIRYWFEIDDANKELALSFAKEIGVELHEMSARRWARFSKPCGNGFGDKVWRMNYQKNGIEASFAKPCKESVALKRNGFKWHHESGLWYAKNTDENADICISLGLKQADSVTL